jgi:hypothetical protein
MAIDRNRQIALEKTLGAQLPPDLLASLNTREPISEGKVDFVAGDTVWDVRTTFTLDGTRTDADQLDCVYDLVGDVMPPGALPVAQDWGGNYYCLMVTGSEAGRIVYWDHERDLGEHHTDPVAESLNEFLDSLVPDPRDVDAA